MCVEEKASMEEMKKEAEFRLQMLQEKGLHPQVLEDFTKTQKVYYSDFRIKNGIPTGILFPLSDKELYMTKAQEVARQTKGLVFHATHELFSFGEILDVFFVSPYKEEWEYDRNKIENDLAFVEAINLSDKIMSDMGTISFYVSSGAGLIRLG